MNCKMFLRFYFFADGLEKTFNNLIEAKARSAFYGEREVESLAEEIIELTQEKIKLGQLWNYFDEIIRALPLKEIEVLRSYGGLRVGVSTLKEDEQRQIKRVTTKFSRRLRSVQRYGEAVKILKKYYCVMNTDCAGD